MVSNDAHKIMLIANSSWYLYNFKKSLIHFLRQNDFAVYLAAPKDKYFDSLDEICDGLFELKKFDRGMTNPLSVLRERKSFETTIEKITCDLVISHTIKPNLYSNRNKFKFKKMAVVNGLGYTFLKGGIIWKIIERLYKNAFNYADGVVFQNNDDKEYFEVGSIVDPKKSFLIRGSGVDLDFFEDKKEERLKGKRRFLFVGRLLRDKGIFELLEALKYLDAEKYECIIVGDIDTENPASLTEKDKSTDVSESVQFVGFSRDIKKWLQWCDVMVLPSYREGLPRACLEAMSMSRAIAVSDVAGCREVIENEKNGMRFRARDSKDLKRVLQKFIDMSDEDVQSMGETGRSMVKQHFSNEIINQEYLTLIKGILK